MDDKHEKTFIDFDPNDFVIRISPVIDEDDSWTGELNVGYMTMDDNFLKDDDYTHVHIVTNMAVSSIPLMEDDLKFRDQLYNYTVRMLEQSKKKGKPEIVKDDSNIIQLRFGENS